MATLANGSIPTVKVETVHDRPIKDEPMENDAVPYMDDQDEDGGDLDFSGANRDIWLGHVPRGLWNVLSSLGSKDDDEEIEVGTIRVEGPETQPQRVSLMLNPRLPQFSNQHKEYNLFETPAPEARLKRKAGTLIFSEQDLPGYESRKFIFNDVDADGNPSQGYSRLFAFHKRKESNKKRKADKEKEKEKENEAEDSPPLQQRIPKKTALQGVVGREFNLRPVKNQDYVRIEALQAGSMLHQKKKPEAMLIKDLGQVLKMEGTAELQKATMDAVKRKAASEKQARRDNQTQRMDLQTLQGELHRLFARHRIWKIKQLKAETRQPEGYLRATLEEMAFQHTKGDWVGMWEMKKDYREVHLTELQDLFEGERAPEGSDAEMMDDEDFDEENDEFVSALD